MIRLAVILALLAGFSAMPPAYASDNYVQATVADAFIELRTGAGRGYPIFYIAERGETVTILKERTDWFKVRTARGKQGWVYIDEVARLLDASGQQLAVAQPQFQDYLDRRWETGFMVGDWGGTDAISAYLGYHFTRNLAAEIEVTQNFGDFSQGKMATAALVHQVFPEWRFAPFITLGGGTRVTEPKGTLVQTEDRTDDVLLVGGGLRVYLSRRVLLRLQYKQYTVLTSRDDDEKVDEWKIGLSAFF